MARKISERERLITFVLNASVEQLQEAKELIDTALRNRAPKKRAANNRVKTKAAVASENPPLEAD